MGHPDLRLLLQEAKDIKIKPEITRITSNFFIGDF
jgi:hypothetical protein